MRKEVGEGRGTVNGQLRKSLSTGNSPNWFTSPGRELKKCEVPRCVSFIKSRLQGNSGTNAHHGIKTTKVDGCRSVVCAVVCCAMLCLCVIRKLLSFTLPLSVCLFSALPPPSLSRPPPTP